MTRFPSRLGAVALVLAVGLGLEHSSQRHHSSLFLPSAAAQTVEASPAALPANSVDGQPQIAPAASASPAAADQKLATAMVDASTKGRHLAPHDTFYLLAYVAVKTNDGVEGFDPGQEVHLVEVHRATHTLVVSDGHAQVEVPPFQLTNDLDIAALVRRKDEASQARIAAHLQAEQVAYAKFERAAADATTKDLRERRQEQQQQAAEVQAAEQAPVAQTAQPTEASTTGEGGYYGYGGYGYGNPYSYFAGPSVIVAPRSPAAAAPNAGATTSAPQRPGAVRIK